jgi:hypothetical protein
VGARGGRARRRGWGAMGFRLYLDTETDAMLWEVGCSSGPEAFATTASQRWCEYQTGLERLRVTVAVAWRTDEAEPRAYVAEEFAETAPAGLERGFEGLFAAMAEAEQICAWNAAFDLGVLAKYAAKLPGGRAAAAASWTARTFDPMLAISELTGRYVGLGRMAEHNLETGKSAEGASAVRWFREGQWEPLVRYCADDVRALRAVVEREELWVPVRMNNARRPLEHTLLRQKPAATRSVGTQTTQESLPSVEL